MQVEAVNATHYSFSAGPGGDNEDAEVKMYGWTRGNYLIPYYSGVVVGTYATSNGKFGEGAFDAYFSGRRYTGLEQIRELPPDQLPVYWDTSNTTNLVS